MQKPKSSKRPKSGKMFKGVSKTAVPKKASDTLKSALDPKKLGLRTKI